MPALLAVFAWVWIALSPGAAPAVEPVQVRVAGSIEVTGENRYSARAQAFDQALLEAVLAVAREFDGGARALDAVARADGDQGLDARLAGTLQHVFAVCVEAVRGDVAMAVEPHR